MKKVLVISYYSPPVSNMATQRLSRFLKYMPRYGWYPIILTVKPNQTYNEDFVQDPCGLPSNIRVYYTKSLEMKNMLKRFIFSSFLRRGKTKTLSPSFSWYDKSFKKIWRQFSRWFLLPDEAIGWLPFAIFRGVEIVKRNQIKIIYSSSPPYTAHLIGHFFKMLAKKPWIAEFRDAWVDSPFLDSYPSEFHRWINKKMERDIVISADRIITLTQSLRGSLIKRYPNISPRKIKVIYNGFDSKDFEGIHKEHNSDEFIITYAGKLYGGRTITPFLQALSNLIRENPIYKSKIQFDFIGSSYNEDLSETVKTMNLSGVVKLRGYLPYQKVIEFLLSSNLLLLIKAPNDVLHIPGKLFEYMGSNRPILALVPPCCEAARIINSLKIGVVVHPKDTYEIQQVLLHMMTNLKYYDFACSSRKIDRYDVRNLTRILTNIFNSVTANNS